MNEESKELKIEGQSAMSVPEFCPRDGSIMVEGVKFGFAAWVCQSCTYWKIKTS